MGKGGSMSIFERIQRIAKANVNWLLDRVEPPEQELESRIRELEQALREGRECAATYGATFRRMEREQEQLRLQQAQWQQRAQQAVAGGDDDTARRALGEKVRLGERVANLTPGIEQGRRTYDQLRDNLAKLQDQLRGAKLKLEELRSRRRTAEAQKAFGQHLDGALGAADGAAFERLEDTVLQTEAEVEVADEIRGTALLDADLEQRSRDLQVDAELRALKAEFDGDER